MAGNLLMFPGQTLYRYGRTGYNYKGWVKDGREDRARDDSLCKNESKSENKILFLRGFVSEKIATANSRAAIEYYLETSVYCSLLLLASVL